MVPTDMTREPTGSRPGTFVILVVCTANICRSPLAEHVLRAALAAAPGPQPNFAVSSAGVFGWVDAPMDAMAAAELRRLGGDPGEFRSHSFQGAEALEADLVLTATLEHRRAVLVEAPEALRRTFTLLEFAHLVSEVPQVRASAEGAHDVVRRAAACRGESHLLTYDLPDPYGQGEAAHRETADLIYQACLVVARALTSSS